jgi:hypothetical protein
MSDMDRFVQTKMDLTKTPLTERNVVIPVHISMEFEHYCRKRNLSFNQAMVSLIEEALMKENKPKKIEMERQEPNASLFMGDTWK